MRPIFQIAIPLACSHKQSDRMKTVLRQAARIIGCIWLLCWPSIAWSQSDFPAHQFQRIANPGSQNWRSSSEFSPVPAAPSRERGSDFIPAAGDFYGTTAPATKEENFQPGPPPPFREISVSTASSAPNTVSTHQPSSSPTSPSAGLSWQNAQQLVTEQAGKIQAFMGSRGSEKPSIDVKRMLGSLAIVLGGYFAIVFLFRSFSSTAHQGLPRDVVQVLGRTPLSNKQTLQLVKLGNRLLLLLESADGIQPIAEVAEPEEVEYIASLCADPRSYRRRQQRTPQKKRESMALTSPAASSIASIPNLTGSGGAEMGESLQQSLTNIVRTLEIAARQNQPRRGTSYEA